ncbi:uncharacterized protein LOC107770665 [Nicotiana tabacum]|uniref:Uncharacterized protein LOC107770665 n=1 Tax=Nicotiana tabacum TaxID=4097 RepID=A0A1S3Y046_TOBAC|nr:uncharacterized protein LOC104115101 [Nicotiana tomentosiformis]XP_016445484.1 PREDICTED: uncharacterized protein LOC107770665 [Nicotiana tabacum]
MMQTLNPYPSTSKTAEIMARYRPIAPKPEVPTSPVSENNPSGLPANINKSPFLRNVWPQLQARPTRTRKRGRTALGPPTMKRARTNYLPAVQFPHYQVMAASPAHRPNAVPHFSIIPNLVPLKCGLGTPVTTPANSIALPLLSCTTINLPMLVTEKSSGEEIRGIDLNLAADVPEELDFMPQLMQGSTSPKSRGVITPRPVRPVGSSISIGCINEEAPDGGTNKKCMKKPEEVEEEVEAEALPAVISDSNNKVRLTNSAYKEMVGQPECCWLDYMRGNACKRIGGEVMLEFLDSKSVPMSSDGFTCWVKIEWGADKGKKNSVKAFCNAVRLACQSKDYLFEWRFHTTDDDAPESASSI